jgi:hypothetical protein
MAGSRISRQPGGVGEPVLRSDLRRPGSRLSTGRRTSSDAALVSGTRATAEILPVADAVIEKAGVSLMGG